MRNIEYIVTAEFHVDKGPTLLHQFPLELPGLANLHFLPELMLPDQIHKREEDYTLFLLFKNNLGQFQYLYDHDTCEPDPYFLYTIVINIKDLSYKRGNVIKSLSIITQLSYFKNFKPLILMALDLYFKSSSIPILEELYLAINSKDLSGSNISLIKKLLITSILDLPIQDKLYYDDKFRSKIFGSSSTLEIRKDLSYNLLVPLQKMNIPIKVPLISLPDTFGDYLNPIDINFKPNLINLLKAKLSSTYLNELTIYGLQTPPIIILINAILTGKRIIFLSYENSSGYIIDHILLVLKIVTGGGILSGIFQNNLFPIIDVSKIELLEQCTSYIAGTINPFFKNNDKLWDLLYDLDSNEFFISSQNSVPELKGNNLKNSIISEDARFLSNLQLSLFNYNDDLTTIQLIFRRHINEIIRILLSSKNFNENLSPSKKGYTLLLEGIGYFWNSDSSKLLEVSCYQLISKEFQHLLFTEKLIYNLMLPNLANELGLIIDLQYQLQKINNISSMSSSISEREIWFNILKYLISAKSLEIFLLTTYLIPPNNSSSVQSSSHGGNLTIFDKNKGIELLLINLFNEDDQIKSNSIMILQELQDSHLSGWCLNNYIQSNVMYEIAFEDLVNEESRLKQLTNGR